MFPVWRLSALESRHRREKADIRSERSYTFWKLAGFQSINEIFFTRPRKSRDYAETYFSTPHPANAGAD
jgi:hypothetical protein